MPRTATDAQIKRSYRKMALQYHPVRQLVKGMHGDQGSHNLLPGIQNHGLPVEGCVHADVLGGQVMHSHVCMPTLLRRTK